MPLLPYIQKRKGGVRMEGNINHDPLRIYCKYCGSPTGFDILRQTYRCPHCNRESDLMTVQQDALRWRELKKRNREELSENSRTQSCTCPSCGAHVLFPEGDVSEVCDFCGSKLIRSGLLQNGQMPEIIIPFFITPEEARRRMLDWGHRHQDTPEGRSIVSNMGKFRGYYLPYQLVRGPVYGTVKRDGNKRLYHCAGYLEKTAVNISGQLDNLLLNEIEPYDWSAMRPFTYEYLAGQKAKLSDLSDAQTDVRIREEAAADFLPEVEKTLQSSGVKVEVETGSMNVVPVLLPVYFIKSGKLTAVMNGQTGRIAVTKEREKRSNPWVIEALLYTFVITLIMGSFFHFAIYPMLLTGFVFACIFLAALGEGRHSLIRRITHRTEAAMTRREEGELKIDESRDILKNPYDNTPVFYERDPGGRAFPVQIRFLSLGRWFQILTRICLTVFLPRILAAILRLGMMGPGETFSEGFRPIYGAAWYVLTGFAAVFYLVKDVRKDIYDHPILYEVLPGGKKRRIGKRSDRKVGISSMLRSLGNIGILLAVVLFALLAGSVAAIIS